MTVKPWLEMLPEFEGRVNHMYLDTAGVVTCGVGCALFDTAAAVIAFGDARATVEWRRILALPRGHGAAWYAPQTALSMSDKQIDQLLACRAGIVDRTLERQAPDYASWPAPVRDACMDIVFNTGNISKFPHMLAAIRSGDYVTAAAQSHRDGIGDARNQWTHDSILSAGVAA